MTDLLHTDEGSYGGFFARVFRTFDKRFVRYTIVGLIVSVINVAFLWFLIDVLTVGTVQAGILATALVFLLRYVLLMFLKVI